MPQKLIRLTSKPQDISPEGNVVNTADTECVFSGLFDEDLHIKQNSEIALQSLSVERKSQEIRIKKSNNQIKFASVLSDSAIPPGSNQTAEITPLETYNKTNDQVLLDSITNGMNKVCDVLSVPSQMNIQHKAYVDNGNVKIEARVSPFYTLDQGFDPRETNPSFPTFVANLGTVEELKSGAADGATGIHRDNDTLVAPVDPAEAYIHGTTPFIKSTGALRVRFNRLQSPDGEVSGYFGFVKGETGLLKLQTQELTEADMEYAFRINGHANPMDFKTFAADSFSTTGVTPINYTVAGAEYNDILEITLGAGKLRGNILQNAVVGGTGTDIETPLKTANVADGEDLYWFISLVEGKDKIVFDFANVSVDPFFGQENTGIGGDGLLSTFTANQALTTLTTDLDFGVDYDKDTVLTPVLRLSDDVVNFLGWPSNTLKKPSDNNKPFELTGEYIFPKVAAIDGNDNNAVYDLTLGYFYRAPEPFDNDYEADNYIIDTQSFILDSFDSYGKSNEQRRALSGGSRRNILATVPVSEEPISGTANGIIQYEPNNLNFIRINNRNDIITRQLRFRLLTGRYQNVPIQNMAAMTILIKDPDHHMDC